MIGFSNKNFLKAMDLIDASHEAGHLLSSIKYAELYRRTDRNYIGHAFDGKTTNPHFDDLPTLGRGYRVKTGTSAHTALFSLLNEKETIIECGVALAIAYYLFLYFEMEDKLGKEKAQERFDSLFGSKDGNTPETQRLIITPFSIMMGTAGIPLFGVLPVQPLSCLLEEKMLNTKEEIAQHAKIGAQIVFAGDPNYTKIHPAGAEGAYNGIITSLNPIKVRIFDHPGKEWTEEDLYAHHKKAYSTVLSFEDFAMLDETFKRSKDFIRMIDDPTTDDKIPGFVPHLYAIEPRKLNFLIEGPIRDVKEVIQRHIHACQLRQIAHLQGKKGQPIESAFDVVSSFQKLSLSSTTESKHASTPSTLKPNEQEEAFAGLDGLRGAFSRPKKKATPRKKETEKRDDYLPGFASGFLNNTKKPQSPTSNSSTPSSSIKEKFK